MNITNISSLVNTELAQIQLNIPFGNTIQKGNLTPHQIAKVIVDKIILPSNWRVTSYGGSAYCDGIFITIEKGSNVTDFRDKTKIFIYKDNRYQIIK